MHVTEPSRPQRRTEGKRIDRKRKILDTNTPEEAVQKQRDAVDQRHKQDYQEGPEESPLPRLQHVQGRDQLHLVPLMLKPSAARVRRRQRCVWA